MQSGGTAASGLEQTATLQVTECEREGCVAVGNGLEVRAVVSKQDSTLGLSAVFMAVYFVRDGVAKSSKVKWFISETPVGVHERTSMKEHLV